MARIGGIVLCGGQSKRMGRPKAWLPFGQEFMLQRVVRLLGETVYPLVVVAAPDQALPALPNDVIIVRDAERGRGPLQAFAAGFAALEGQCDAAYASSCDVPFVQPSFVRRMIDLLGTHQICVPYIGGYYHPLAAIYRLQVNETVHALLAENRLRPTFLFELVSTRIVQADELADVDPALASLRNLNTLEDYEQALRDVENVRGLR